MITVNIVDGKGNLMVEELQFEVLPRVGEIVVISIPDDHIERHYLVRSVEHWFDVEKDSSPQYTLAILGASEISVVEDQE